jgi:hypothetical protein
MAEPKPLASLTPGLLARKGAAQPAMRRPSLGFGRAIGVPGIQDDLGWNDMGHDVPVPVLTPMSPAVSLPAAAPFPPVVTERAALAERIAKPIAAVLGRKAAFTLRLDGERHLKLRLACAIERRSAQQMVTQALDEFLNGLPEIDRLAKQLPRDCGE